MTRGQKLLRLQEVENDLREKLTHYKKVQAALGDSLAVKAARQQLAEAEQTLTRQRSAQGQLEHELRELEAKLKSESERLYSGSLKHHKEVENVQREVESLQRRRGTLDEHVLRSMEGVEQARDALSSAQLALAQTEARWRDDQSELLATEQKLKRYIAARRRDRDSALAGISAADLARFRALQGQKGGKAVAALREGVCGICGVNVSASKIAQVRSSDELIACGNCGRILAL